MKSSTPALTAKRDTPPTRKAQFFLSTFFSLHGPGLASAGPGLIII